MNASGMLSISSTSRAASRLTFRLGLIRHQVLSRSSQVRRSVHPFPSHCHFPLSYQPLHDCFRGEHLQPIKKDLDSPAKLLVIPFGPNTHSSLTSERVNKLLSARRKEGSILSSCASRSSLDTLIQFLRPLKVL